MGATLPPPSPTSTPRPAPRPVAESRPGIRRVMIVGATIAVAGAVAVALAIVRDIGEEATADPGWSAIAIAATDGRVMIVEPDGDVVAEVDAGVGRVERLIGGGPTVAVVGSEGLAIVDIASGDAERPDVPDSARVSQLVTSESLALVAAPATGGGATIVTADQAYVIDELADLDEPLLIPEAVRSDAAATMFAIPDARSFQTVVVGAELPEALFLPGLPLAVGPSMVVSVQPAGDRAELRFTAADGRRIGEAEVPNPLAGALLPDGDVVFVTEGGAVVRAGPDGDTDELVTLGPATSVTAATATLDGQRLVIATDQAIVVVDGGGDVVSTTSLPAPLVRAGLVQHPAQRCVFALAEDGSGVLIDTESGAARRTVDEVLTINAASSDGCVVAVTRADGFAVVRDDTDIRFDRDTAVVAVSPDGRHVVVRGRDGALTLRALDGAAGDVALPATEGAFAAFVER